LNVKNLILAFICVNISVALVENLGIWNVNVPYTSLTDLQSQFSVPDNWENIVMPSTLAVGGIVALALGYGFGAWVLLLIGVLNFFWRPAQMAIGGFGLFLSRVGAPSFICQTANVFSALVWMFFIIEYLGGRQIGETSS